MKCFRCSDFPCSCSDGISVFHGDCRNVLRGLSLVGIDLVLTDPPYGIHIENTRNALPGAKKIEAMVGDDSDELAAFLFSYVEDAGVDAVVFGAQNWPHLLPHKGRLLCWDKRVSRRADRMIGSPFEIAWENRRSGYNRMVRIQHGGVVNADKGSRKHKTQKPVSLFTNIIAKWYSRKKFVLDPFLGSGTVLLACKMLGLHGVGVEVDESSCQVACSRLDAFHYPGFFDAKFLLRGD